MKKIISEGKPHLCLFAIRDITVGEEITYNYGGTDWPWRNQAETGMSTSQDQDPLNSLNINQVTF